MTIRTTFLFSLSFLTAFAVGCANPWRMATSSSRELAREVEPTSESRGMAETRQSEWRSYDEMLDGIEGLRNRSPEQDAALKRELRETSGQLSLSQQQQFLRLAETLVQKDTATDKAERLAAEADAANGEPPSLATVVSTGRASTFRITDADESPAADTGEPASTPTSATSADEQTPAIRLATHHQPAAAPPASLDAAGQEVEAEQAAAAEQDAEYAEDESFQAGQWKESISASIDRLEKELVWTELDDSERVRLEASLRLLYAINNQRDKAVTPIAQLRGDEQAFWKHQLYGLSISLDAEDRHVLSRRAALALRELRTAVGYLSNISSLDLRNLALCTDVQSYGRYEEIKPSSFDPGQEVILYVEVENFTAEAKDDEYETELQGEYTILDSTGKRVVYKGLQLDKQACKNRRRDYFIAYRIFLPDEIAQGEHTLVLTMEDVKGQKSNQGSIEFRIR